MLWPLLLLLSVSLALALNNVQASTRQRADVYLFAGWSFEFPHILFRVPRRPALNVQWREGKKNYRIAISGILHSNSWPTSYCMGAYRAKASDILTTSGLCRTGSLAIDSLHREENGTKRVPSQWSLDRNNSAAYFLSNRLIFTRLASYTHIYVHVCISIVEQWILLHENNARPITLARPWRRKRNRSQRRDASTTTS